jgi:glycosyltransferase involved in cell wall biosynthesis
VKIAFLFGRLLHAGRELHFDRLWTDERGLTGSEVACVAYAQELAKRGHHVTFFCPQEGHDEFAPQPRLGLSIDAWGDEVVETDHLDHFARRAGEFDAVLSWCEPDLLRVADPKSVRLCNQQLNDFAYCRAGYDDAVDVWTSPSKTHRAYLQTLGGSDPNKWLVLPNGCYADEYGGEKVPGRCVYTSSPDRGLHLVLQEWPNIRRRVPGATLKIFYFALQRWLDAARPQANDPPNIDVRVLEHRKRARYVEMALSRLVGRGGVEVVGGVSRAKLAAELSQAEVLTYPCSTLAWTEGFSCATLEGCASGALPVISTCDALGEIYGASGAYLVSAPAHKHMAEWTNYVVQTLGGGAYIDERRERAKEFAKRHDWSVLAADLESILERELAAKRVPTVVSGPGAGGLVTLHMTLTPAACLPAKQLENQYPERDEHGGGARAGFLGLARAMASRGGYRVRAYAPVASEGLLDGVEWVPFSRYRTDGAKPDVLLSYFDFSTLVERTGMLRIASHHSCSPYPGDPYDWADLNVAPSRWAVEFLRKMAPEEKWAVLPNAIVPLPKDFVRMPVPGRVIHHAPPSRGLHLLLEVWPEIRRRVPEATLHVIGPLDEWMAGTYGQAKMATSAQGRRVTRIRAALPAAHAAGGLDILGQVPRSRLLKELSEASCFAYPCTMIKPSETFSITVLECMAASVPVVLAPADALEELWGEAVECTFPISHDSAQEKDDIASFAERVCWMIDKDPHGRDCSADIIASQLECAKQYTFENAAAVWDTLIKENLR